MMTAAIVQHYIYQASECGYYAATCEAQPFTSLNVWIQTPSYVRPPLLLTSRNQF